jgi:RNA polymerase sigma-70 factor (ECF subfamily)
MPVDALRLAKLIENHAGALRLWVRSRCASCEDVVQEAFCKLAMQDPPPDNPVAWLYRVCRNLAERQRIADARRRKRERSRAQVEVAARTPVDPLEIAEAVAAVETLEDELREVLVARLWGQLSLEEVAKLCGISTATAFRRYAAALQCLRAKLSPKGRNDHE